MAQTTNDFRLSRRSRAGALILLGLLLAATLVWRLLPALQPPRQDAREKALQQAWTQFRKEHIIEEQRADKPTGSYTRYDDTDDGQRSVNMQFFDPNTASEEVLTGLGLPLRTARTLIKYRSKGGRFRKKDDLQKLYTLRPEDYERIAPYVRIAGEREVAGGVQDRPEWKTEPAEVPSGPLELNTADAGALIALRGIGPGYSRRILSFRESLGGFIQVVQLKEVYGFPDSTYQQLKDQLTVDPGLVKKINVNLATEEELARHPYIGKKLASGIIKLRSDLGSFAEIEQLRQVPLINEEKYRKIAPYLAVR
ncbi:ComEA family DNA-binding protein [Taibaiella koreensis]|uniref:ComEA family DNA-binding protein n=1 Tax=Taibaiella koreensis TaxID=1268548 RepID=UPI000E59C552|nr:helix-hairpin-helix domain-containing protein [Taibaiella koreensis]